jgi:hypothetical protein
MELGTAYIDLAQSLSLVNRKLFRQGKLYYVSGFEWIPDIALPANTVTECSVVVAPNNWCVENGYQKAKALWNHMNRMADEGLNFTERPKWHDFKVLLDVAHYNAFQGYSTPNELPTAGAAFSGLSTTGAEWQPSQIVIPAIVTGAAAAQEYALTILGADDATANAFIGTDGSRATTQGYASTRVTVGDREPEGMPGDASTNWMNLLFDDGGTEQDVVNHLENHNDQPPYAHGLDIEGGDNPIYPGGSETYEQGHLLSLMRSGSIAQADSGAGGEVFAGLMKIQTTHAGTLRVYLAPGTYQGVAAVTIGS